MFNEHGNLDARSNDTMHMASNLFWNKINPLLENASSVELRALEQAVMQAISVRFAEHRLRKELDAARARRQKS